MSKTLVIVESPSKARTISRFLKGDIQVQASMGHVRDLPESSFGVDIEHDFQPEYELTANGKKVVKGLRQAAATADQVYLATDPDREGEAISWHLREILRGAYKGPFHRIMFHEITQSAIQRAIASPGEIDQKLVDAQQARRVLDRIVGYQVSPLLWRKVKKGTSAGRVQSVALRLVVEREREIQAFVPEEYWNLDALFGFQGSDASLRARLTQINGQRIGDKSPVHNEAEAMLLANALESAGVQHRVSAVTDTPRNQYAKPPFITSTLQQACGSALRLTASQTMKIAQDLYEGVELGEQGSVGLITYMRTDSVNIAKEAQDAARQYIAASFGPEYVPAKPNVYRSGKSAQEAHEAIRPTDVTRTPDSLAPYLKPNYLKVYRIIWNRFVASQMACAKQVDHVIEIESSQGALSSVVFPPPSKEAAATPVNVAPGVVCTFRASSRETLFPGYLKVYSLKDIGETDDQDSGKLLPKLAVGLPGNLLELLKEQCFTSPSSRYTEASLVKALEQNGVGRPSTFATTVNMIQTREYVSKEKGQGSLIPTELGFKVNDFLVQAMPELFDIKYTSKMESKLDDIEEGTIDWIQMLHEFYHDFQGWQGANMGTVSSLPTEAVRRILDVFPPDMEFDAPITRGIRKYDDKKFCESLREQIEPTDGRHKPKELSVRQVNVLMTLMARYYDRVPTIATVVEELGLQSIVQQALTQLEEESQRGPVEIPPALTQLLTAMANLEWEAPVKRGARIYDDGKFFKSLKRQVEGGKLLSDSQQAALLKLAGKYSLKIPDYTALVTALGGTTTTESTANEEAVAVAMPVVTAEQHAQMEQLFAMTEDITEWHTPTARGRRTFDDHEFADSLKQQFEAKGTLTERQIAALKKMLTKYEEQIPNYEERSKQAGIGEAAPKPQQLDEKCPKCGAPLVQRMGRGQPFIGCSAFPKCRYIKPREKK